MQFSLTDDQLMIADTAKSFLSQESSSAAVRKAMATAQGFDDGLWQRICSELGWQLTQIPEQQGGLQLGFVELCLLLEQAGSNLLCAPFYSTAALGVNSLLLAANEAQQSKWLGQIAEKGVRLALAYSGGGRTAGVDSVTATYTSSADGHQVNGSFHYVIDGHTTEYLILVARSADDGQLAMFIVDARASGITRTATPGMDQTRKLARVEIDGLSVASDAMLGDSPIGDDKFEQILALAQIALAAEQVGVADRALEMTVEYISERKQFGRTVGSFQAMKHKAADMMSRTEAARSALYYAACIADEYLQDTPLGNELLEAASIAKSTCCDAAYFNAGCAIQMHGGVGFTWEYDVHLYFKRAKAAQLALGDSAWHRERLATSLLGECCA